MRLGARGLKSKKPARNPIPEQIRDDDKAYGRFKVKLGEALAARFDVSDWRKLAMEHSLEDAIVEHPRFLRSAQWQDSDYEGLVVQLVDNLCSVDPALIVELFDRPDVQLFFRRNAEDLLNLWEGEEDPMLAALAHGVSELQDADSIDLDPHRRRIERALPDDPPQAVGATKEMLEAAMRTILDQRGVEGVEALDFPSLTTRCFNELGLSDNTRPTEDAERLVRKMASSAKSMILAANELRNAAGTGHGRVASHKSSLTAEDARLVAASGFMLTAWLLRRAKE